MPQTRPQTNHLRLPANVHDSSSFVYDCDACGDHVVTGISNVCRPCENNVTSCNLCGARAVDDNETCDSCSDAGARLINSLLYPETITPPTPRTRRTTTPVQRPINYCMYSCGNVVSAEGSSCDSCRTDRTWTNAQPYVQTEHYDAVKSTRRYGVEIETSSCDGHRQMRAKGSWASTRDGSIDGLEFVSVPMAGDAGFREIDTLFDHAKDNEWQINSACGLHLHLDATDLTEEQLFKVARAYLLTYDLWSSFIPQSRKNNYYCAKHFYSDSTLDQETDFKEWVNTHVRGERYCWINFGAYLRHGTFELRNHTATLNKSKLKNWIRANVRFIDKVKDMSMGEIMAGLNGTDLKEQFKFVSDTWDSDYLEGFYKERAEHFGYEVV